MDAFLSMLAGQGGVCAICKRDKWGGRFGIPMVDHDHSTGRVRGILCCDCNMAIGRIYDNPDTALSMAEYLRSN